MIGDLAPALEPDEAVGVDLGDLGVGRIVVADRRHVADRPSARWSRTTSCWVFAGALRTRDSGRISSRTGAGAAGSSLAPSLIQSWRNS